MEVKLCHCYLTVKGISVDILRFDREFEKNGDGYSLNNLYPPPCGLDDAGAYTWRNSNWGTPWDVTRCFVCKSGEKYEYAFAIGWEAPSGAMAEASKRYPRLAFTLAYGAYAEEGRLIIEDGKTVHID